MRKETEIPSAFCVIGFLSIKKFPNSPLIILTYPLQRYLGCPKGHILEVIPLFGVLRVMGAVIQLQSEEHMQRLVADDEIHMLLSNLAEVFHVLLFGGDLKQILYPYLWKNQQSSGIGFPAQHIVKMVFPLGQQRTRCIGVTSGTKFFDKKQQQYCKEYRCCNIQIN